MASLVSAPMSLARVARPLHGEDELEQLLDLVAHAKVVVLGAASYGTHEHYELRASLARKLIGQRDFAAVVIEADWPDALRVDRYVRNQSDDDSANAALAGFDHFPAWAWRNTDVERFVEWLRIHNYCRRAADRAGFYGLDVFSMNASMRAMRSHVDASDEELLAELVDMQWRHAARSGRSPSGAAWLHAMPHAVKRAEQYYTTLLAGGTAAWNQRSVHMADSIEMLGKQLGKLVVWAHDVHAGDARALGGERTSLGQHMRERYGDDVALVGFTTYAGTVRCAPDWDAPDREELLVACKPTSWESLFHETGMTRFMITSSALRRALGDAEKPLRWVGAVQRAEHVATRLADQFDVVVHVDTSSAVEPLVNDTGTHDPAETCTEFAEPVA